MTILTPPQHVRLDQRAVDELRTTLHGELIRADDDGYEQHRQVWNGSIDRHPALIVRCAGGGRRQIRGAFREDARPPRRGTRWRAQLSWFLRL